MKNLIIIGAGGMGREVMNLALQCEGYNKEYVIKGFIDDNLESMSGLVGYPPIIGRIDDYKIKQDDVFTCSIGSVQSKKKCIETIVKHGGSFISLIHPTSLINSNAKLGIGCQIFPFAQVGSEAVIGNYVLIQSYAGIAHDVNVGNYTRIDTHVLCVGGVSIGNRVTLHTAAIINHGVTIEDDATVGAASFVIKRVRQGTSVFGIPAKIIF